MDLINEAETKASEEQGGDREDSKKDDTSKKKLIQFVEEIREGGSVLFTDQYKNPFLAPSGNGTHVVRIRSRDFKNLLAKKWFEKMGVFASNNFINEAQNTFAGLATFQGEKHSLSVRTASKDDSIWYDLGSSAVQVYKNDWIINNSPPILFHRFNHQKPQVVPEKGGDLQDLRSFTTLDDNQWLLFQVLLVASIIPNFPHPVLVVYGPQGATKSTLARIFKELADPSAITTASAPSELREFVQFAFHHLIVPLDNMSFLSDWLSDALSRASTGDGFSKRELFTDDEDVIYNFQRTAILNGINLVVGKPDLLDRSVLMGLKRVSKKDRREEKEFWKRFYQLKPKVLGAIFTAASKALASYDSIQLDELPRMADFTKWGCAIAQALEYTQEQFLAAYDQNINQQNQEAIQASPVALALTAFMEDKTEWEDTPSKLLEELETVIGKTPYIDALVKVDYRSKTWPKDAARLTKFLKQVETNLAAVGVRVEERKSGSTRFIKIYKEGENTVPTVPTVPLASKTQGQYEKPTVPNRDATVPTVPNNEENQVQRDARDARDSKIANYLDKKDNGPLFEEPEENIEEFDAEEYVRNL